MRSTFLRFKFILILVIIYCPQMHTVISAQEPSIAQTEDELKNLFGLDKVIALNRLTQYYLRSDTRKALKYGRQAVVLAENIFIESNAQVDPKERHQLIQAYFQLGKVLFDRENYLDARESLETAKSTSFELGDERYLAVIDTYLGNIQALVDAGKVKENFFTKTFGDLKLGETISEASKDLAIETEITLGQVNENKGKLNAALDHYKKAVNLLKDKGDAERIVELQIKIASVLDSLDQHIEAQLFLSEAIEEIETEAGIVAINIRRDSSAQIDVTQSEPERKLKESRRSEQKNLIDLSESYAREKDFKKSLAYYKLYQDLSRKMEEDSLSSIIENKRREGEILLLRQQKQIADLNVEAAEREKERQIRLRNTSILIALLILASSFVTLYFYATKRRQHKKLTIAYRDLDKTKGKLVGAEQRIVKLLSQHVSGDVAKELLMNYGDKPGERRFVCIMFLDIRDFTPMAEKLSPEEIITYQNTVFGFMIDVVQKYHGTLNQLLGDGFMASFGAPVSHGNDCQNAFEAANEILREVKERNDAGVIKKTTIGIGLHAGYVVTGNVGNESRKQYSVTGNPVIVASRIEQLNKEYKTQFIITEEVYEKLDKPLKLTQPFLEVEVKGRTHPVRILKIA